MGNDPKDLAGSVKIEAGLALLINLTGKLRMLSHRSVMLALLGNQQTARMSVTATPSMTQ